MISVTVRFFSILAFCSASPIEVDFDNNTFAPFSNTGSIPWTLKTGPSNSASSGTTETGPTSDHTTGSGYYVYVESSAPNFPSKGPFVIEMTNITGIYSVSFWYSMYGANMGSLNFDTSSDGSNWSNQWFKTGNQGTAWQEAQLSLVDNTISSMRFYAITGSSVDSDIAIDDLSLSTSPTSLPTSLPTVTPSPTATPSYSVQPTLFPTMKEYERLSSGSSCSDGLELYNESDCVVAATALGYTYIDAQFFSGSPSYCFTEEYSNSVFFNTDTIGVSCSESNQCVCKYVRPTQLPTQSPSISTVPSLIPTPQPSQVPTPPPTITCQNGTYFDKDSNTCLSCEKGTYTLFYHHDGAQPTSCTLCPIGQYGNSFGSKACIDCDVGKLSTSDRTSCEDCQAGQYNNNSENCVTCETGKYAPTAQDESCIDCLAGDHTNLQVGATTCSSCDAGKYSEDLSVECINCLRGSYSTSRSSICTKCAISTYNDANGSSTCMSCGVAKTSLSGATSCDQAVEGYYISNDEAVKCPSSATCDGGVYLPFPKDGYWSDRSKVGYLAFPYKCPRHTCRGGVSNDSCWKETAFLTDDDTEVCDDDKLLCRRGSYGPLCSSCEENFRYSPASLQCEECESSASVLNYALSGVVCLAILALVVLYGLHVFEMPQFINDLVSNGSLTVLFSTYQIVESVTLSMDLEYPSPFSEYLQSLNFLNFELPGLQCSAVGVYDRVYFISLVPVGVALLIVLVGVWRVVTVQRQIQSKCENDDENSAGVPVVLAEKGIHEIKSQHAWALLFLSYLVLPPVTSLQFKALDCFQLSETGGSRYLRMDTAINCESEAYKTFAAVNSLMLVAYLAIPLCWFVMLRQSKKALFPYGIYDDLLLAKKRKLDRSLSSISFLFERYRSSMIYWECVDVFRRILFIGLIPLIATTALLKSSLGLGLAFVYVLIVREVKPYAAEVTNMLSFIACIVIFLTYEASLAIETGICDSMNQLLFGFILLVINISVVAIALCIAYYQAVEQHRLVERRKNATVQHVEWGCEFSRNKFATTFETINATVVSSSHCAYNYYGTLAEINQVLRSGIPLKDQKYHGILFSTHQPHDLTEHEKRQFGSLEAFVVCSLPKALMSTVKHLEEKEATTDSPGESPSLFVLHGGILQGLKGSYFGNIVDAQPWEEGKTLLPPQCIKRAYQLDKDAVDARHVKDVQRKGETFLHPTSLVLPYHVSLHQPKTVGSYLNKMDMFRDISERAGLVCLYHYTMPAIAPLILDGGFRMSTQGQGDGGVYFSTLGPSSYQLGSDQYEDNIIIDCFGKERLEEYKGKHKLDVCLVYAVNPSIVTQAPGGRDNAVVVPKSYFEDLSLPHFDGSYFLRPDHIMGAFMLDPAHPPLKQNEAGDNEEEGEKGCSSRLAREVEKDLKTQYTLHHQESAILSPLVRPIKLSPLCDTRKDVEMVVLKNNGSGL